MYENAEIDDCLTEAEELRLASLPKELVARIDEALLAKAQPEFRKVAYIVGSVMGSIRDLPEGLPDVYYERRVAKLVEAGFLESQGNLRRMRFSEVRLPSSPMSGSDLEDMIASCQYGRLGRLYAEGQGVPQDYVTAFKWYSMAADEGDIWAQLAVGRFYEKRGYGIQQ